MPILWGCTLSMSLVHRVSKGQVYRILRLFCFRNCVENEFVYSLVWNEFFVAVRAGVILLEPALDVDRAEQYVTIGALDRVIGKLIANLTEQVIVDSTRLALLSWVWWIGQFDKLWLGFISLLNLSQLHFVHFLFKALYFGNLSISACSDVRPHLCNRRLEFFRTVFGVLELLMASNT